MSALRTAGQDVVDLGGDVSILKAAENFFIAAPMDLTSYAVTIIFTGF